MLFPFGEYLPGAAWFPWLKTLFRSSGSYRPGPRREPLPFRSWLIAVTICYEDIHPLAVNAVANTPTCHLLLNITDDAWFRDTPGTEWHFNLARLRAVEQRRFSVRVANSGVSAAIDPVGRVVTRLPANEATAGVGRAALLGGDTVFSHVGFAPWWLVTALLLLARWVRAPHAVSLTRAHLGVS